MNQIGTDSTFTDLSTDTVVANIDSVLPVDTVYLAIPEPEPPTVSLFESHLLNVEQPAAYIIRPETASVMVFAVLLICSVIILYLQRSSTGVFMSVLKASFDRNLANQDARVENSQRARSLLWLRTLAFLSTCLFFTGAFGELSGRALPMTTVFLGAAGILVALTGLKHMVQWLLSSMFDLQSDLRSYRFSEQVIFSVSGLMLVPISLLLFFSPMIPVLPLIYVGLAVWFFFYLKALQRGILIALSSKSISALHLFYYFCALEILPFSVLIRLAHDWQ